MQLWELSTPTSLMRRAENSSSLVMELLKNANWNASHFAIQLYYRPLVSFANFGRSK